MTQFPAFRRLRPALALAVGLPLTALAHEGHNDAAATPSSPTAAVVLSADHGVAAANAPHFVAASDTFELVGTLDGRRLTLWLDWSATNAPIEGASVELEVGDARVRAVPAGDVYVAELPAVPAAAVVPVTATVTAGRANDLLAGEFALAAAAAAAPAVAVPPNAAPLAGKWSLGATALGSTLAGALLGWTVSRKRRQPTGAQ